MADSICFSSIGLSGTAFLAGGCNNARRASQSVNLVDLALQDRSCLRALDTVMVAIGVQILGHRSGRWQAKTQELRAEIKRNPALSDAFLPTRHWRDAMALLFPEVAEHLTAHST